MNLILISFCMHDVTYTSMLEDKNLGFSTNLKFPLFFHFNLLQGRAAKTGPNYYCAVFENITFYSFWLNVEHSVSVY